MKFPPGYHAPGQITLAELRSLSEHGDPNVRHFSGTASYATSFELSPQSKEETPEADGLFDDAEDGFHGLFAQAVEPLAYGGVNEGVFYRADGEADGGKREVELLFVVGLLGDVLADDEHAGDF